MCQIIPYTLPCCRRAYISISKLPSCDDTWPRKKCPAELCIQIFGTEPEERNTGTCWRCTALVAGKAGAERENLRPAIDKARITIGLEEFSPGQRRRRVEIGGYCWFCDARGGCKECGTKEVVPVTGYMNYEEPIPGTKRNGHRTGFANREKDPVKRVKLEHSSTTSFFPKFEQGNNQTYLSNARNGDGYSYFSNTEQLKVENTIDPNLAPTAPMLPGSLNWHPSYAGPYGYQPAVWGFADPSSSMAIDPALTQDNTYNVGPVTEDYTQGQISTTSKTNTGNLEDFKVCFIFY